MQIPPELSTVLHEKTRMTNRQGTIYEFRNMEPDQWSFVNIHDPKDWGNLAADTGTWHVQRHFNEMITSFTTDDWADVLRYL